MSKLLALRCAKSLSDLAILLDFRPSKVSYILYKQLSADKYSTFLIPKRGGGHRTICAPQGGLKLLQRKLADLLQDSLDEINQEHQRKDRIVHGFKRNRSIITNARRHRNRRWVLNVDIKDFFPSINFGRIRGLLIKDRDFQLDAGVATVIAQIACHQDMLPQGSPCSPVIANLVARVLDVRLVKLARRAGCTYSRYADDLTFSTNKGIFPNELAIALDPGAPHDWKLGDQLRSLIESSGFWINERKTRVMYRSSRQEVTGLVTNERISVPLEYRRKVRAMVHKLTTTGSFEVLAAVGGGAAVLEKRAGTMEELSGRLGFVYSTAIYGADTARGREDNETALGKSYRTFLFYRNFYAADCPTIICEGKTDNVYLTHAIRNLASEFPALASAMPDGKIKLKIRLFKYHQSSTCRLMGLMDGGSGVLKSFIQRYEREVRDFGGAGLVHPVIILFDNDEGSVDIWKALSRMTKRRFDKSEQFIHVVKNLYAIPTPGQHSKIEDFFHDAIKSTQIDGKVFSLEKELDREAEYGKNVFAHKVVAPKAQEIDFTLFRPLLMNLSAAIVKHRDILAIDEGFALQ